MIFGEIECYCGFRQPFYRKTTSYEVRCVICDRSLAVVGPDAFRLNQGEGHRIRSIPPELDGEIPEDRITLPAMAMAQEVAEWSDRPADSATPVYALDSADLIEVHDDDLPF